MSIIGGFWRKICEPLDGFLWQRDITHHLVRPLLRNEILAAGACILAGAACYAAFPWLFWFGAGLAGMSWIFWSWARFFLRADLAAYNAAFLRAVLLRFGLRLIVLALLLYGALAWASASAPAILAGMIAGAFLGIISYGYGVFFLGRQ